MVNRDQLPPQAYTKETVSAAYSWLQEQPLEVRQQAQTTDQLVSLYRRAQRVSQSPMSLVPPRRISKFAGEVGGGEGLAPVEEFTEDLRGLLPPVMPSPHPHQNRESLSEEVVTDDRRVTAEPYVEHKNLAALSRGGGVETSREVAEAIRLKAKAIMPKGGDPPVTEIKAGESLRKILDKRSWEILKDIQARVNLGSELEALRFLIVAGFEKISGVFPKGSKNRDTRKD